MFILKVSLKTGFAVFRCFLSKQIPVQISKKCRCRFIVNLKSDSHLRKKIVLFVSLKDLKNDE